MHNVGKSLDGHIALDLYGAEIAYPAQVVSAKVNEHIMLGKLLFVCKQLGLKRFVLLVCLASGAGACKRKGMQHAVFKLYEGLGRCACYLDIGAGKVEHIRRGIGGAQDAVGVEQAAVILGAQAV